MITLPCNFTLIDSASNKARWYYLNTSTDLFGNVVLIKRWGRIGRTGQEKLEWFPNNEALADEVNRVQSRRLNHGYIKHTAQAPTNSKQS